jgi:uncharacterized repeat protein (TIGR01451 family)/CSLREA domain-containing protein
MQKRKKKLAAGAAFAVGTAIAPQLAQAAVITVDTIADDAVPLTDGDCSLREAIENANNGATFADCTAGDPGLDTIDFSVTGTITLDGASIDITDTLTIDGPGVTDLIVDANDLSRHFTMGNDDGLTLVDVTIRDLSLINGDDSAEAFPNGGSIYTAENLTLINTTISGNDSAGSGGAISLGLYGGGGPLPTLTIQGSTLTNNTAFCCGGAVSAFYASADISDSFLTFNTATYSNGGGIALYKVDDVTITNTSISNNQTGPSGIGGGLYLYVANGDVTIEDSTISDNTSVLAGGFAINTVQTVAVRNTTVSGNDALYGGGGGFRDVIVGTMDRVRVIGNDAAAGSGGLGLFNSNLTIVDSEITGNDAASGSAGGIYLYSSSLGMTNSTVAGNSAAGSGGGIYLYQGSDAQIALTTISGNSAGGAGGNVYLLYLDDLTVENSIIANGTAATAPDLYTDGGNADLNFTLLEDTTGATFTGANNITGVDPQLGPLQNNGGPTQTLMPAGTSPAVNAGDPSFTPPPLFDQRGPGFDRVVNTVVDMGSVELQSGVLSFSLTGYSVAENGVTATITVTRSGGSEGAASVDFATAGGSATSNVDFNATTGTLTWTDGDAASKTFDVTINDDPAVEGNEVFTVTLSNNVNAALGTSSATVTIIDDDPVVLTADLGVTKDVVGSGPFFVGQDVTFTITVSNAGPDAAANTTVTDVVPPGTVFVSATPSAGSCAGTTTVTCNVGTLASGGNATITLVLEITNPGAITNTAAAESDATDPTPASDSATINAAANGADIPTLSEWMLLALASALAAAAALKLRS